jgi:hypothetical protein
VIPLTFRYNPTSSCVEVATHKGEWAPFLKLDSKLSGEVAATAFQATYALALECQL